MYNSETAPPRNNCTLSKESLAPFTARNSKLNSGSGHCDCIPNAETPQVIVVSTRANLLLFHSLELLEKISYGAFDFPTW